MLFTIFSILLYPLKHYFNSQGADQEQNVTDLAKLESVFQQHPELHHQLAPVINCAATRVERAESNLKVQQQEQERSAEERELFQRMRGVARDSAVPTYDYHNFENSKRPRVTENAQVRAVSSEAVVKKKKQNDYASQALSDLRNAMKKSLPNR